MEAHLLTPGGLDWLLGPRWPQDPPRGPPRPLLEPNITLQDRCLGPPWRQDPLPEGLWKQILHHLSLIWGAILVDFWLLCWSAGFLGWYFVGCLWSGPGAEGRRPLDNDNNNDNENNDRKNANNNDDNNKIHIKSYEILSNINIAT